MSLLLQGRIATGGAVVEGWLEVDGERIAAAGDGQPPRAPDEQPDGIIAPGRYDLQVNGAAGHEVTGEEPRRTARCAPRTAGSRAAR